MAPQPARQISIFIGHVERDDLGGRLRSRAGNHAEPDRSTACDDHHVVEADVRPLDGVQCTGERLDECGVRRGKPSADRIVTSASAGNSMYSAIAPGVRRLNP